MAENTAVPETTTPSGGRSASDIRAVADTIRSRTDLFGKALAAIATLGTTAVGLSKVGDLFPVEGSQGVAWVVIACAGLFAAALAAIGVAVRLMKVAGPIFMPIDITPPVHASRLQRWFPVLYAGLFGHPADVTDGGTDNETDGLTNEETEAVAQLYLEAARRFGYTSLEGLQYRERSLRNAASHTFDKDERARRTALADQVKEETEQALARGQVLVVRRRATAAVRGPVAWILYVLVIGGLITFAIASDKVVSDRKDLVANAKACADARTAGATVKELKDTNLCDPVVKPEEESSQPSAAEARAKVTSELAAVLVACAALIQKPGDAESGPLTESDCEAVRDAVSAMADSSP